ncbi:MAG: hypothetical protein NC928_02640 [Candidatus Omnitrophica bacterium]|nr:hypothetical protein [Candidatus Omnitrophota bacterium]
MKVFITYASAGSGHHRAAVAIYEYFSCQDPRMSLKLLNVLDYAGPLFRKIYIQGYNFLVRYLLGLWSLGYKITKVKFFQKAIRTLRFIFNRINTRKFTSLLMRENPDYIISTHFIASEIVSSLKRKEKIKSQLITLITDYGVHPFWINCPTDIYVVASDYTKEKLKLWGIKEEKIKVWGIPLTSGFLRAYAKESIFNQLGISPNRFTILIATGSFGIGPIENLIRVLYLCKDIQLLVVCAHNKRLFNRLKFKNYPGVKIFAFVDNMAELMAVSDLIITKPGGLTIAEVLAMNLVPIFMVAIPGQETENLNLLRDYGIGVVSKSPAKIKEIVLDYKLRPDKLNKIRENIFKLKKTDACKSLYYLCQSSIGIAR